MINVFIELAPSYSPGPEESPRPELEEGGADDVDDAAEHPGGDHHHAGHPGVPRAGHFYVEILHP